MSEEAQAKGPYVDTSDPKTSVLFVPDVEDPVWRSILQANGFDQYDDDWWIQDAGASPQMRLDGWIGMYDLRFPEARVIDPEEDEQRRLDAKRDAALLIEPRRTSRLWK